MIQITHNSSLPGHEHPIYAVSSSQKEHIFFTGGGEAAIVEWNLKTKKYIKILFKTRGSVYAIHCPKQPNVLLAGDRSGYLHIFDFEKQSLIKSIPAHERSIFDIQSDERNFYTLSEDGSMKVWSFETFETLHHLKLSNLGLRCMALHPLSKWIAVAGKDMHIYMLDKTSFNLELSYRAHDLPIFSLCFSEDGKVLFSGSRDAQLKFWDIGDFTLQKQIPAHYFAVNSLCIIPESDFVASASMDKSIKIWNAKDYHLYKILDTSKGIAHRLSVNKIIFSAYENQLISVSDDKLIHIWDIHLESAL